jgi:hypothetical protein
MHCALCYDKKKHFNGCHLVLSLHDSLVCDLSLWVFFCGYCPSQKTEANWSIYKAHLSEGCFWWCTFHDLQFETLLLLGRLAAGLFPCLRITRKSCLWFIHPSWCWWEWSLPHWTYPKDVDDLITVTARWKPCWQPSIKQFWLVEALCHILFRRAASHAL